MTASNALGSRLRGPDLWWWGEPLLWLAVFSLATTAVVRQPTAAVPLFAIPIALAAWLLSQRNAVSLLSLFLVLLLLIPSRWVFGPVGGAGTPAFLLALGLGGWWGVSRVLPDLGFDHGRQPMRVAAWILLMSALASFGAAMARPLSGFELAGANRTLLVMAALFAVLLAVADGVERLRQLEWLLGLSVALVSMVAVIAIVQFTTGIDIAAQIVVPGLRLVRDVVGINERGGLPRVSGTATHAIEFGLLVAATLPLAIHFGRHGRTVRSRSAGWGATGILTLAMPLALSRSALAATLISLLVVSTAWSWAARRRLLVGILVVVAVLTLLLPAVTEVLVGLFTEASSDVSVVNRMTDLDPVLQLVAERPVLGLGLGTFAHEQYFMVDNQYLQTLVDSGIVGLLGLLAPFAVALHLAHAAGRRATTDSTRHLARALMASVGACLVGMGALGFLNFKMISGLAFFMLGSIAVLWRLVTPRPSPPTLSHHTTAPVELPPFPDALYQRLQAATRVSRERSRLVDDLPGVADEAELGTALVDELVDVLDAEGAAVWVLVDRSGELRAVATRTATGPHREWPVPVSLPRRPLSGRRMSPRPRRIRRRERVIYGGRATRLVVVPLHHDSTVLGFLAVAVARVPGDRELAWVGEYARLAGAALAVNRAVRREGA